MAAYKKLSRQRRTAAGYSRLWLANDHVLLVTSSGYSEEYRRFFFSDIQALFIRKTRWGAGLNWMFGGFAVLLGAMSFAVANEGRIFLWILASLCAAAAGINAALGPTCTVNIQTAIARHPLEPLQRLRTARKVIARILPIISAAQGEVSSEQLATITKALDRAPKPITAAA
jgi:hypothetical protein